MRSVLLVSALTAGVMFLAFGGTPAQSQTAGKDVSCQTCAKGDDCPHCAAGKDCPHCTEGKTCPYCKQGKTCTKCGKDKAHQGCHGKWGSHKWEYKCVRPAKKPDAMTKQFSGLGEEGWKLVEADGGIWCFSRIQKTQ
ncbi:MAG: hypothetical protein JRJ80_01300 [Deltaproteobacteria bacterium]|jgi:hypothetical protein|nr:hypothetical protein [Deltaproteobacteria bacterium]